jgi:hypothetical protein
MNDQLSDDNLSETRQGEPGDGTDDDGADDDGTDDRELAAAIRSAKGNLPDVVRAFVLQSASRIEPAPTQWLWPGRIPLGNLTLLAGDPDAGKSLVTLDMAARVSTATPWPDEQALAETPGCTLPHRQPGNVLIFTTHDHAAATLRPRLERAGADLQRVIFATGLPRRSGTEREIAEHWLRLMLSDGSRPAREVLAQAAECWLSITTLRRAKAELGVTVQRIEFEKGRGHWSWSLGNSSNAAALEDQSPAAFGGDDETARIGAAG